MTSELKDFRPISLVGGPYKILSKILANRLGGVLGSIISKEQSAFVKGRQILDCIVTLNGVIEDAKRSGRSGFCYKIDFAKAYDSVEWSFLSDMLRSFGFCDKWVSWIRECVETAHADVLVNGSPSGDFKLGRGLRQGDPISPFLFIIAAECIGMMMKRASLLGLYEPMEVGPDAIKVSHLQFADDTIFLGKTSLKNALFLKRFLIVLELVSGLRINKDKCQVVAIKADRGIMIDIADILCCRSEVLPFMYLGLRVGCRHKKAMDWNYVVDKVRNRLTKWSKLKISLAGRITLVKSVLSALPTYALSIFKAPVKILRKLRSLQQAFLWGGGERDRKIVWAKWDDLSLPKELGGFGVRDLECFNNALMGKWAWRALEGGNELWVEIVTSRVRRGVGCLSGIGLINPEGPVRGWWGEVVQSLRDNKGGWFSSLLKRQVGNGVKTSFWYDIWIENDALRTRFPRLFELSLNKNSSVANAGMWVDEGWCWGLGWRRGLREWETTTLDNLCNLLESRKVDLNEPDRWLWELESNGVYSVRSAYKILLERKLEMGQRAPKIFKLIWSNMAVPKVQATAWRIIRRKIATKVELVKRGALPPSVSKACSLCGDDDETIDHLFLECSRSWEIWGGCLDWLGINTSLPNKISEHFYQFCHLVRGRWRRLLMVSLWECVVWTTWKKRNDVVFNNGSWNKEKIIGEIKSFLWGWLAGNWPEAEARLSFHSWCSNPFLL